MAKVKRSSFKKRSPGRAGKSGKPTVKRGGTR